MDVGLNLLLQQMTSVLILLLQFNGSFFDVSIAKCNLSSALFYDPI